MRNISSSNSTASPIPWRFCCSNDSSLLTERTAAPSTWMWADSLSLQVLPSGVMRQADLRSATWAVRPLWTVPPSNSTVEPGKRNPAAYYSGPHVRRCNDLSCWAYFISPYLCGPFCFSWLYNLFSKFINKALRNALQKKVCTKPAHCDLPSWGRVLQRLLFYHKESS